MKRDFLKNLGLADDAIEAIMSENGKDINAAKADGEKLTAELSQTKSELEQANAMLEKVKDYDAIKADVEKYKADAESSRAEYEKKLADMERANKVKDFTSGKKFVNELTRNAINAELSKALEDSANAGKSLDDLLKGITDGKENIFATDAPPPPRQFEPTGSGADNADDAAIRKIMGLPPKKE